MLLLGFVPALRAQRSGFEVELRDGSRLDVRSITGSAERGLTLQLRSGSRTVALADLIAIRGTAAQAPELLRARLAGGDVLHGALAGGDEVGDTLELLSPVLGSVALPIDRLAMLVQPGVDARRLTLPDGVDEAVFVPTGRGFDLVAGTLHRFGARGVAFQSQQAEAATWYAPTRFVAVRLGDPVSRERPAPCVLWTRTADRVGVTVRAADEDHLSVVLENGAACDVRWADVAALVFEDKVRHLSTLEPAEVVERGFDGGVVYPWRRDGCAAGGELIVMGRSYGRGIGVHSYSRLRFVVPADATHFRTSVGIDDSAAALPIRAHAVARVLVDDEVVFEASALEPTEPPQHTGPQPVRPGQTVTLEVECGKARDLGDRVDWLLPMFLLRSGS